MTYAGALIGADSAAGNVQNLTNQWADLGSFQADDIALSFWEHVSGANGGDPPTEVTPLTGSGFTFVDFINDGAAVLSVWKKVLTGSESGNITGGHAGATRHCLGTIVVRGYSDVNVVGKAADAGTNNVHTTPSATPSVADVGVVIASGERANTGSTSATYPGGYTQALVVSTVASPGGFLSVAYEGSAGVISGTHAVSVAISPGDITHNVNASDAPTLTVLLTPAVTAFNGVAALSGSGGLTTLRTPALGGAAALSGSGSLAAAATPAVSKAAALSGTGTLTAVATPAVPGVAALSGTGTLTGSGTAASGASGAAALSGSGALAGAATPAISRAAALSGSGSLTAATTPRPVVAAALSGSGTLAVVATPRAASSGALSGSGTLTASGTVPTIPDPTPSGAGLDVRLVAYAPNGARQGPIPAPQSLSASYVLNDTGALSLNYPPDGPMSALLGQPVELVTEISTDGGQTWGEPFNGRFLYLQDGRDPIKTEDAYQISCPSYVRRFAKALVPFTGLNSDGARGFTNANPGTILNTLFGEAQARGALTGIAWDFSASVDSSGVAWPSTTQQTIAYSPGTDFLLILQGLADAGLIDYRMNARTLQVYIAGTTLAEDHTDDTNRVSLRWGRDLTEAPFRRTWEALADTAYVQGDNLASLVRTNGAALKPWGRQETFVTAGGVTDTGTLTVVADGSLAQTETARIERTYGLDFTRAVFLPFLNYDAGAWVYGATDGNAPERMRVRQVTLTRSDQGVTAGNVVLNDRFVESDILQARRLTQVLGGATLGGSGTPSSSPVGNDILAPAQVTGLSASSSAYVAADGYPRAQITVDWADVTTNADATPTSDVDHYEVWRRRQGDVTWTLYRETNTSQMTDSPYEPNETWEFKVRAVDNVFNRGAFSTTQAVTTATDVTPPAKPSTPTVSSTKRGIVQVNWNGLTFAGGPMDDDLLRVEVHASTTNGFTATQGNAATLIGALGSAGSLVAADRTIGAALYVVLLPVDTSLNPGPQSNQVAVTVSAGTDTVAPTIPGGWDVTLAPLGVGALMASWPVVPNADLVTYTVYLDDAPVDGTNPATKYGETTNLAMPLWKLPDGTPLDSTSGYYIAVKVKDDDGTAAGAAATDGPVNIRQAGQDLIAVDYVYAGDVEAAQIKTGTLDAALAIAQEIYTATSGRRISMGSANGFQAVDADGNVVMAVPTDLGLDTQINSDLVAKSITALGPVAMRDPANEVAQNAVVYLRSGTTAPVTPPAVQQGWAQNSYGSSPALAGFIQGGSLDNNEILVTEGGFDAFTIKRRSRTTGAVNSDVFAKTAATKYVAHSVVKIGAFYYTLGVYSDRYRNNNPWWSKWWVTKWTAAGTFVSEWEFGAAVDFRDRRPVLFKDAAGTGIWGAWGNQANSNLVRMVHYTNPDTDASFDLYNDTNITHAGDLASGVATSADFGAARVVLATRGKPGGDVIYVVPTSGTSGATVSRDTNNEWPAVSGDTIAVLVWDSSDNLFRQLSRADQVLSTYDGTTWSGASTKTVKVSNTWKDTDTTSGSLQHETAQGPVASLALKKRARITVTTPPIPTNPDNSDHDDATAVRVYAGDSDGAYNHQFLQASPADGIRTVTIVRAVFSNADTLHPNPPQFGNFPNGTPARVASDDGTYYVDGNGDVYQRTVRAVVQPYAQISNSGASGSIANASVVANTYDTTDPGAQGVNVDLANDRLEIVTPGRYLLEVTAAWAVNNAGIREHRILVNGTAVVIDNRSSVSSVTPLRVAIAKALFLGAGDLITSAVQQTSGGATTISAGYTLSATLLH